MRNDPDDPIPPILLQRDREIVLTKEILDYGLRHIKVFAEMPDQQEIAAIKIATALIGRAAARSVKSVRLIQRRVADRITYQESNLQVCAECNRDIVEPNPDFCPWCGIRFTKPE